MDLASGINGSRNPKRFSPPSLLSTPLFYLVCLTPPILYLLAVFLWVVLIFLTTDKLSPNNKEESRQEPWMKSLSVSSVTKRKALVPLTVNWKISGKDSDWSILDHRPRWLGCGERLNLGHHFCDVMFREGDHPAPKIVQIGEEVRLLGSVQPWRYLPSPMFPATLSWLTHFQVPRSFLPTHPASCPCNGQFRTHSSGSQLSHEVGAHRGKNELLLSCCNVHHTHSLFSSLQQTH